MGDISLDVLREMSLIVPGKIKIMVQHEESIVKDRERYLE